MNRNDINPEKLFATGEPTVCRDLKIVFTDVKGCSSKYVALNTGRKKVCKITIDGKMITNSVKKCDYGLWVEENNRMILIELKGRRVEDALEQLNETYQYFCNKYGKDLFQYAFRIVLSKCGAPRLVEQIKQERKRGKDILVRTQLLEEKI